MKNKKNIAELNKSLSQLSKSINTIKSSKKESAIESDKKNDVKSFSHALIIIINRLFKVFMLLIFILFYYKLSMYLDVY